MPEDLNGWLSGLKRAMAVQAGRWLGTFIGGGIATYIFAHAGLLDFLQTACSSMTSPAALSTACGGLGVAIAMLFLGTKDVKNVNAKMAVAAASAFDQGAQAQSTTDETKVQAVAQAMKDADQAASKDKAAAVASLGARKF